MCHDPECICYDDHKECDESLRAQQEAIVNLRSSVENLQSQLRIARETLIHIRDHVDVREGISQSIINRWSDRYDRGLVAGHRAASKLAAEGLALMDEAGKGRG